MTTDRQLEASRQNAKNSTGPKTERGKRRSRRNAFRHGLTAETIIDVLEDPADYAALEAAINADYRPGTNFELELVARLVSLLWRLRRAVAIESGLINIQADALRKRNTPNSKQPDRSKLNVFYNLIPPCPTEQIGSDQQGSERNTSVRIRHLVKSNTARSDIARSFLRLANLDNGVFERLGRYEMSLWRQTVQIMLLLNSINRAAKDEYADCDAKYLHLKNSPREWRRLRWPPFIPFA
jgi:hypothetical protein